MTTFLLIRHALTDAIGHSISGWTPGVHLNAEGRLQAERLASGLAQVPIGAIYSSPLERARETADFLAAQKGIRFEVCEQLGEVRYGDWSGCDLAALESMPEWRRYNWFRSGSRIPGGELMIEVQARAVAALCHMRDHHLNQSVAVVTHGDAIKAAIGHFMGIPVDLLSRLEISPASVSVLRLGEGQVQILGINATGDGIYMPLQASAGAQPAAAAEGLPASQHSRDRGIR